MRARLVGTLRATSNWSGVSSRTEFFSWLLAVDLPLLVLAGLISGNGRGFVSYIGLAIILVAAVPTISLTARRLHDSGRSAGWMLAPVAFAIPIPMLALTYALSCFDVCGPRSRGLATALQVDFWLFAISAAGLVVLLLLPSRQHELRPSVTP